MSDPPHGETQENFKNRVLMCVNSILTQSELPLIIAHSGTFLALSFYALGMEYESNNCQLLKFEPIENSINSWKITKV